MESCLQGRLDVGKRITVPVQRSLNLTGRLKADMKCMVALHRGVLSSIEVQLKVARVRSHWAFYKADRFASPITNNHL
jgi:hypothetical protein